MNKTYQELCDEVLMLREQLEDERRAADLRCAKLAKDLEDAKALAHQALNANLLLRLERRADQGKQGPAITEGAA
ncbi:hypothetical protein SAMN05661010_00039 [Modicisalibacter muralis]|uniref:Uncharacterized protein n=1 Tax=Modicisalibacter muralis TaxID=119000 RepID=A0A1G9EN47_9GAMM|nr:hypothetical protein [Halomonas muralis]SDK77503.1 hypothetical protein SAMN05661010_00039 [Halomonas muralis]